MRLRFLTAGAILLAACSSSNGDPDAAQPWPECPDGSVVHGDRCVDPGGLSPCELIAARGGCPEGFRCDERSGTCVAGVACGEHICWPGEVCGEDGCTCGEAPCPGDQVCAPVRVEDGVVVYECVPPTHDGDGDGHAVGDLDGDGLPDDCNDLDPSVNPDAVEICDGIDNNCNGLVDEGFDADGDGYTTCGTPFTPPDCDDSDPTVHPGAVDLCRLGPDGVLLDVDCNPASDSCPFGSACCPGVEGCVDLTSSREHCGRCGRPCTSEQYCVVGVCRGGTGELEPDPEEGEVTIPADEGTSGHPDVAFNWARRNSWFSWRADRHTHWYNYHYWELDYGIAWVQQVGSRGLLLFTGRHFVSTPFDPRGEVSGSVGSFLSPLRALRWYDTILVDVLDSEDTIPCLAPSGGLGYGLAWSDGRSSSQVHFAAIGGYGMLTGWAQQLTYGSADSRFPRLAWSPYYYFLGAGFALVYQREDDEDVQVFFQPLQSYWDWWSPFGLGWRVSNDAEGAFMPDVAWSPFGYGVVWVGAAENELYFSLVGPFGGHIVRPQRITTDNSVVPWRPSIVWNEADGEFAVAYQATSPPTDNHDIYFVRISPYGTPLAPPVRLTSDPELQRHPEMAWTGDGFAVTWYDRRSGTNEIALVLLEPGGTIADGPTMLTSHTGGGEATNPAITFASVSDAIDGVVYGLSGWRGGELVGDGELALVWRDQPSAGADARVHFLRLPRHR